MSIYLSKSEALIMLSHLFRDDKNNENSKVWHQSHTHTHTQLSMIFILLLFFTFLFLFEIRNNFSIRSVNIMGKCIRAIR